MAIADADFDYIRWIIQNRSAIVLEESKRHLVEIRLLNLARKEGYSSVKGLVIDLRAPGGREPLYRKLVESMCNNETLFFRDHHPFEALRESIIPELIAKRRFDQTLNFWSAACSSGQEPYSLAMLIKEHFPQLRRWRLRIIGSDISTEILTRAERGLFSQLEVNRGLPAPFLVKYFERQGVAWRIRDDIRQMVEWKQLNLVKDWPLLPEMDVVMLRNVMIYFNQEAKKDVLARMRRQLRPDGYLFLGSAETTTNIDHAYTRVSFGKAWCYRLR